jgi:hypothetical protein
VGRCRVAIAAALASGCGFTPASGDGDDGTIDAPIADDAPDAGDGLPAGRCGGAAAFLDDFGDGTPSYFWVPTSSTVLDLVESGGALTIAPSVGRAAYDTYPTVVLRDTAFEIEVPAMLDVATTAVGGLVFADANGARIGIAQQQGYLYGIIDGFGTVPVVYDPVQHRWWRVAVSAGVVTLSTSPDGTAWTDLHTGNGRDTAHLTLSLFAEAGTAPAGAVTFQSMRVTEDGVRVGPAPWCKISTIADTFASTPFDPQWFGFPQNGGCALYPSGDRVYFDHYGNLPCFTALLSRTLFDLTDSALVGTVDPIATSPPGWSGTMALGDPTDTRISIVATGGSLCAQRSGDGAPPCVGYGGQIYWRISESGGTVTWEASIDGVGWQLLRSAPTTAQTTRLRIGLGAAGEVGPSFQFSIDAIGPL